MKRNMQSIILVLAALCLNLNGVLAQERSYEGNITIEPVRLEQLGETIYIDIDIVMDNVKVKSSHGIDFIPQLVSSAATYDLPRFPSRGKTSIWFMNAGWH